MASVAARLGAPTGSIYHRFRSRKELMAETWLAAAESFQAGFIAALHRPARQPGLEAALHAIGAFLGVVAIALSIYIAYRFAGTLARWLGTTGLEVMVRLSAFILMCIGIQIVWNGYSALSLAH